MDLRTAGLSRFLNFVHGWMIERLRAMGDREAQQRLDAFVHAVRNRDDDDPAYLEAGQAGLMAGSVYRGPAVLPGPAATAIPDKREPG